MYISIEKIGNTEIQFTMNNSLEKAWRDIAKQFFKSHKSKYESLNDPYYSMLKVADFIAFEDEKLPANEPIEILLNEKTYFIFFLLKRSIWKKFNRKISIRFVENQIRNRNYLHMYMNNFVNSFKSSIDIAQGDESHTKLKKNEIILDPNLLYRYDFSPTFQEQCNIFQHHYENTTSIDPITKDTLHVDVVMPTKHVPLDQITRALNSFVKQLKQNDRIYLIDDNDSPRREVEALSNSYDNLRYLRGNNKGVANARNVGLLNSMNELVVFIDSDDYVSKSFIEVQRDFHRRNLNVAATGTWLESFGSIQMVYPQWDNLSVFSLTHCLPPAGVLMWKRKVLQDELNGFRDDFASGFEDFDLTSRASLMKKSIVVLEEVHYYYQRGHNSLTQSWTPMEEYLYTKKILSNARGLNDVEFSFFLDVYERYGPAVARIPFDEFSLRIQRMRDERLFWILINRVRLNPNIRKKWLAFPKSFRVFMNRSIWLISRLIDKLHETKFGSALDPIYRWIRKTIN